MAKRDSTAPNYSAKVNRTASNLIHASTFCDNANPTPDGEFPTLSAACLYYNVSGCKFRKWMLDMPKDFFFVIPGDDDTNKVKGRRLKAVSTPDGIFPSINSAARHFNVGARTIKTWVRKMRADEFKYV